MVVLELFMYCLQSIPIAVFAVELFTFNMILILHCSYSENSSYGLKVMHAVITEILYP